MQIRTPTLCLALVAGLGVASAANAVDKKDAPRAATPDTTLYFNGVRVAVDPATGRLRQPSAAELQALRDSVKVMPVQRGRRTETPATRVDAQRTVRKLADGRTMAVVSEDMYSSIVATRNADGTLSFSESGELPVQGADSE